MPFYHRLGEIPPKRHTQFRREDGELSSEEVIGVNGFSGIQSILYHHFPPTAVLRTETIRSERIEWDLQERPLAHRLLDTGSFQSTGDPITSRRWMLGNSDVRLALATPSEEMNYFYRNGLCDEVLFLHEGEGVLHTPFGELPFQSGDYLVIPVGVTYRLVCKSPTRMLVVESNGRVEIPKRYRNEYGQLLEHAPFCERDCRPPGKLKTFIEKGEFPVHIKQGEQISSVVLDHHPFDVIGWDGFLYPWALSIHDFEPITGRIHQPPPVHQTFQGQGFVLCSFVPRMFDYHPKAIPVPYNHSNVNSDEVIYYVAGTFMSRKGVGVGTFTLHPSGIPHGPHPGIVEASLGATETKELAVMVDTFSPLKLTTEGAKSLDERYMTSWTDREKHP